MPSEIAKRPIAQQLIAIILLALLVVFTGLTAIIEYRAEQAAVSVASANLEQQAKLMSGTLDMMFDAVKVRGERTSQFFLNYIGGAPVLNEANSVQTGAIELPTVTVNGTVANGNEKLIQAFRDLTGDDATLLLLRDNKVYRLATVLKDKNGNSLNGTTVADGDPVAKSLLAGRDYFGLAIRDGKYTFSTAKLLRDARGNAWGAYSVRISLDDDLRRIRDQFSGMVAGKTGYVFIVRPTDEKMIGEFVLHPKFQGKTVAEADLSPAYRAVVGDIITRKDGLFRYSQPDSEGQNRDRISYAATSSGWGWTVSTGSWLDEYLEETQALRNLVIVISVVSAILLAVISFFLVQSRLRGLVRLVDDVSRLSRGDLRTHAMDADPSSRNEVHAIAHAFNLMSEGMRNLVRSVADTSSQLGAAAGQLRASSAQAMDSAQHASQSASSIAASVEELSVSITQVADNANQAAGIANDAKSVTSDGRLVVHRTMEELERVATDVVASADLIASLGERSKQISNVVGVIREIAEQTNLLALNAAIEAARAGDQGRGFAVVADEVRKLAERTSTSTQEISRTVNAILEETSRAVDRMHSVSRNMTGSVALARDAGDALQSVDRGAQATVEVVDGIADSTREQSAASQEIARLVEQIAQAAEGSNFEAQANSEQAQRLQNLAGELHGQLSKFQF